MMISANQLAAIAGSMSPLMPELTYWINGTCPTYGIDTPREYSHFIAQACHETDRFKTLREYGSGAEYEGRKDLGNIQKGDGVRFKGRGIFQITGRSNYLQLGIKEGHRYKFSKNPELFEQPRWAVWSACEFWKGHGLGDIAIHEDTDMLCKKYKGKVIRVAPVDFISITINGGMNGINDRRLYYMAAKKILSEN